MGHVILEFGLTLALIGVAVSLAARLRLSSVPFLIMIGMAVGPHAPQIGVFDFRFIGSAPLIEFIEPLLSEPLPTELLPNEPFLL
jgi:CPA2 family monovalent cation:H+ antiporter-2